MLNRGGDHVGEILLARVQTLIICAAFEKPFMTLTVVFRSCETVATSSRLSLSVRLSA